MMSVMPARLHMGASIADGAARYVSAAGFGPEINGEFWASAPKKMSGPMERVDLAHLADEQVQEATWPAVVEVTGADLKSRP